MKINIMDNDILKVIIRKYVDFQLIKNSVLWTINFNIVSTWNLLKIVYILI